MVQAEAFITSAETALTNTSRTCLSHQPSPSGENDPVPSCQACYEGNRYKRAPPVYYCWGWMPQGMSVSPDWESLAEPSLSAFRVTFPMTWCSASRGGPWSGCPGMEISRRFFMEVREEKKLATES